MKRLVLLLLAGCSPPVERRAEERWILTQRERELVFAPETPRPDAWRPIEVESRGWMEGDVAVIEAKAVRPGRRYRFIAEARRPVEWRTPTVLETNGIARFEFTSGARGWAGVTIRGEELAPK